MSDDLMKRVFEILNEGAEKTKKPVEKEKERKPRKKREISDEEREIIRERLRLCRDYNIYGIKQVW